MKKEEEGESEMVHKEKEEEEEVHVLLAAARPFLRGSVEDVDPVLPSLVRVLRETGAAECWHKHGTFLEHLQHVYRILKLWRAPDPVARCGLFHSAYSNSYVNLAIFQPDVERARVSDLVGPDAEALIHLFCIVPRHPLIHQDLLAKSKASDPDLLAALSGSRPVHDLIPPPEGLTVPHIRTGHDVHLPRPLLAFFLLLTMADFIDQLTGWQDSLFGNRDGNLAWTGNNWAALWPGNGKPGLWMSAVSRMGLLLHLIVREERKAHSSESNGGGGAMDSYHYLNLELPPIFDGCTRILDPDHQVQARDAYWEAVQLSDTDTDDCSSGDRQREELLSRACTLNPWIGEPHVLLAQIHASRGQFELAEQEARQGLTLLLQWGTNWDKRVSWEAWVAWSRVLLANSKLKTWPNSSWGIVNLGLVK